MSLLLGVRGSDQTNEGQSFRDNIIQQPGSFYNGNPSSSIWGNPPTQPLWCELPLADEIPSSSSSTSVPYMPSAFKSSVGMVEEKHWQDSMKSDVAREEGFNPSRAERYGHIWANVQQNGKLSNSFRTSDPSVSPFSFGYSPQSTVFGNDRMSSFTFGAKDPSQEFLTNRKPSLDEVGRRADMESSFNEKNEKSWKLGTSDAEANPSLFSSYHNSSTVPQKSTSEGNTRVSENESFLGFGGNKSTSSDGLEPSIVTDSKYAEKKTPEVFVFGASGLGGSSFKSSTSQQKLFQSSFAAPSSRSRTSKFKRHSNVLKGKGLAPLGGIDIQQFAPAFSRDASPQSNTGLESATESSQLDEAECSDAGIWPEDNINVSIDLEGDELSQSAYMSEEKAKAVVQNEGLCSSQEGILGANKEGSVSHFNANRQDYVSSNQNRQEDDSSHSQDTQQGTNWHTLGARFSSWWPFQSKVEGDSRDVWEADGSSQTMKEEYIAAHLADEVDEPSAAFEQRDSSDLKFSAPYEEPAENSLQSRLGGFAEVPEPADRQSSNLNFPGDSLIKEGTQNTGGYTVDSIWNFGGNDPGQPFVFGGSQQPQMQADYSRNRVLGVSGTMAASKSGKDERMQGFTSDSSFPVASGLSSSSASFSFGSSAVYKRPASMDKQPFSQSAVFTTSKPVTNITNNVNNFKDVHLSSFSEHDNEGPTGDFTGPLSSESSASESSPSRGEPWPASDKPSNETQCFEFQGSVKDGSNTRMAAGKKKSNIRRQVGGINRQRRAAQSTSFKNTTSSINFSPIANDTELSSGATTLEQPYFNFSGTSHVDDPEFLRQLSELQNLKESTVAAGGLGFENDQDITDGKQVSEGLNDWPDHTSFSSKRSGKWKRRGLDEGHSPSPYEETQGLAEHPGRVDISATHAYTLKQEKSNYKPAFTFGAGSSHTNSCITHRRYARRHQKEKSAERFGDSTSDSTTVCRPDDSGSLDQDRQSQVKPGPSLSIPLAPVDQNCSSGGSRTSTLISNKNHHNIRNFEESTPANIDSSHHFVPGVPGSPNAVKSAAAEQVCERWRLRGNQAYANGDFPKAEEYYSRGASSVSPDETSQSCIRASMLCYSNRAATRMAVGRMREALADCKRAMVVDPGFLRVRLRAASCHLALGESKAAADMFKECLKFAKESTKPDSKILAEAMEGVKKSQQLDEYSDRALELLQKQTFMDSTSALRLLNEALSISSFSEPLHELKAQVLLSLRRYEDCLQFCEQTLPAAERNHGSPVHEKHQSSSKKEARQIIENAHLKLWRWRLSAKALYHLGKLEESLELLVKHEEVVSTCACDKGTNLESLASFLANIRDLLRHKAAGNEAFQLGKHAEAVEHYTAALACNGDSRPFNAVCFCNRAAASQALGHIADAIADCSRAIALDAVYPKALSRRATLHEMIRDYGQACNDLRRLILLLEDYQTTGKNNQTTKGAGPNVNAQDLRQARERLEKGEEEMKKGYPIDQYLVLGVDFSCSANEIKKAYRKAALKHHPDKAGQFLARGENGDDGGLWKEVGDEVRRDAERLFKLIGEAYAILSDTTKRLRYDMEEENRKLRGKDSSNQVSSSTSEGYRSQYEKSGRRQQRDRWDAWQGYAPQHQRWQSGPDAAQPDTFGRRSTYGTDSAKTEKATWNTDFSWDKL